MNRSAAIVGIGIGVIAIYLGVTGYYDSAWKGIRGQCVGDSNEKGGTTSGSSQASGQAGAVPNEYFYITTGGTLFKSDAGLY